MSGLRLYCSWRNLAMEWSFVVFSTIRLNGEVNFFIRVFLEVFYFPSDFTVVVERF